MTVTQSEYVGSIPDIINNYEDIYEGNLRWYLRCLFSQAANTTNPYHNVRHILHVTWLCYQGARFHHMDQPTGPELSERQTRNLLIAALFHDFNHRGAPSNNRDVENIHVAVMALRVNLLPEDTPFALQIENLIRSTEYPHKTPAEKLPIEAQILRDADLSQIFSPAWIQDFVFGLPAEKGWSVVEALRGQLAFVRDLRFCTQWGRSKFGHAARAAKLSEIEKLLEILSDPTAG